MKRTSNSGLYHIGKATGNQIRMWERVSTGVRRRLAFRQLRSRAYEGQDAEARFWLSRLKLKHGNLEKGWSMLNELWFQGCRDQAYIDFLWKQIETEANNPDSRGLNLLDHRVRWNLALYLWTRETSLQVPESIVRWLERGWLGSMEFRSFCEQVEDKQLLVKLTGVLTDHAAHSALLHILYRRLWSLIQRESSQLKLSEIQVILTGLDYLPNQVWQFCFSCWQDWGRNQQQLEDHALLEDLLIDYFLLRRERGFFPFPALQQLGKAKLEKKEKSLRSARLFNFLRLREYRSEEWNLALAQCILPEELPADTCWLDNAQNWTEMSVDEILALLRRVFRSGWQQSVLVVCLGMFLLNAPEQGKLGDIAGLTTELWKYRENLALAERVALGKALAREMTELGKYEQALEIVKECFNYATGSVELYLLGLKSALILGQFTEAVLVLEKAEGCLNRNELAEVRQLASSAAFSSGQTFPAFLRAQFSLITSNLGEGSAANQAAQGRYRLISPTLKGEELYYLRNYALKQSRFWLDGQAVALKDPYYLSLVSQDGFPAQQPPGHFRDWKQLIQDPVYSLHFLLQKLRDGNWELMGRNQAVVNLAYQLWQGGIARREARVLDFLVVVLGCSDHLEAEQELLIALGEYCLAQGRLDRYAGMLYYQVYLLQPDNLPNLFYLCKSLLTMDVPLPTGPGYGANVLVSSSVFSGVSKLPVMDRPGLGPVVQVSRVFSESLSLQVRYFGGEEAEEQYLPAQTAAISTAELDIYWHAYRCFPNYQHNLVNLALLAPLLEIEDQLKVSLLEECLNLEVLQGEAIKTVSQQLAKLMLKHRNYTRVQQLLLPNLVTEPTHLPLPELISQQSLARLWEVGCQLSLGLAEGEEQLKVLTGSDAVNRSLREMIGGIEDGLAGKIY